MRECPANTSTVRPGKNRPFNMRHSDPQALVGCVTGFQWHEFYERWWGNPACEGGVEVPPVSHQYATLFQQLAL
ncbi:hypothetical protein THIOSC15_2640008 [uncultured Thiomicrorhabdus sp.]